MFLIGFHALHQFGWSLSKCDAVSLFSRSIFPSSGMSKTAVRPKISFVPRHGSDTQQKTSSTSVKTITTGFCDGAQQIPAHSLSASTQITPYLSNRSQSSNLKNELVKQESVMNHQSVLLSLKTTSQSNNETIVKSESTSAHCFRCDLNFLVFRQLNWNTNILDMYHQNKSSFSKLFLLQQSS